MSEEIADILRAARQDALPAPVALMRLIMAARTPEEIDRALSSSRDPASLLALWRERRGFWSAAKALLASVDHGAGQSARAFAAAFDRAATVSPEAASALYALGDPALLDAATAEALADLERRGAFKPAARILDIGCGAGRFEVALAAGAASILALEVSPAMADAARRRCAAFPQVEIALCADGAPPPLATSAFDLALAVDSFPYIFQSGDDLPLKWFAAVARALAPGGSFVILNFSYRGDLNADIAEAAALARATGLRPATLGAAPFRFWDGSVFHLLKP